MISNERFVFETGQDPSPKLTEPIFEFRFHAMAALYVRRRRAREITPGLGHCFENKKIEAMQTPPPVPSFGTCAAGLIDLTRGNDGIDTAPDERARG